MRCDEGSILKRRIVVIFVVALQLIDIEEDTATCTALNAVRKQFTVEIHLFAHFE